MYMMKKEKSNKEHHIRDALSQRKLHSYNIKDNEWRKHQ
jgi:hypothetical protein